jgi:membrane peptidoglycan carboxypeptidase
MIGRLTLFVGASALSGVLVAALAVPFLGSVGLVAKDSAESFQNLPSELELPPLPQRSTILAADGTLLANFYDENRISVPLDSVAPIMRQAVVAIEDARFYEHGGVDPKGAARALVTNLQSGGIEQGASTLTMQYVRNVLKEIAGEDTEEQAAAVEQSITRKLQEMSYAVALEQKYTKDQILEGYLNISYFADGVHGVEAASRHYFNKNANALTLPEAALLAGIVQRPGRYDPVKFGPASVARRNVVIERMAELGFVPRADADAAIASPIGLNVQETGNGCEVANYQAGFFCDYVLKVLQNDPAFGETKADRTNLLLRGGLTITTTLDPRMQEAAQAGIDGRIEQDNEVAVALATVEPGTGIIKAMASNRRYSPNETPGTTTVNLSTDYATGNSRGFQGGSTFKTFVLAAAIAQGIPLSQSYAAPAKISLPNFPNCRNGGRRFPDVWEPSNAGSGGYESLDMVSATRASVNTYFAQLEQQTGFCAAMDMAKAAGVTRADGREEFLSDRSFVLGPEEVSPLTMAEAYATFAARGVHCEPRAISAVTNASGAPISVPPQTCAQTIAQPVADVVNAVLQTVVSPGATGANMIIDRPAAGKTGTTNGNVAVWFNGYTPQLSTAVWAGFPGESRSLVNLTIMGNRLSEAFGSRLPGPIWKDVMTAQLDGIEPVGFEGPDFSQLPGMEIEIPRVSGLPVNEAVAALQGAGLQVAIRDGAVNSRVGAGLVAFTDPRSGSRTGPGATVTIYISNGVPPGAPLAPGQPQQPGQNDQAAAQDARQQIRDAIREARERARGGPG